VAISPQAFNFAPYRPLGLPHVLVRSMQHDELRRAIELPARRVGLRADPELTDALVADVKDEPGALPLLSTALLELWQHRDGRRLRYTVYQQTAGVRGAVARLAEDAFGQLDRAQQMVARTQRLLQPQRAPDRDSRRGRHHTLWRADGSGRPLTLRVGKPLLSVRFSRDGRRLVTAADDGVVRISNVRGGPVLDALARHRGIATRADFAAGGTVVSVGEEGSLRRWDPLDSAILHGSFVGASFSPDGSRVLTGGSDGRTRVHNPTNGATVTTIGPDTDATTARYSTDGTRVVTASLNGVVRIADPRSGRSRVVVKPDPEAAKTAADLDRRGRWVVSGGWSARAVLQSVSGRGKPVVLSGHHDGITDVRFSPNGRHVLTASGDDTARIWDAATGEVERTFEGQGEGVNSAAYNADGTQIVTAGSDATVRVWRTDEARPLAVMRGHEGAVTAAAFNDDSTRIVSSGVDGTAGFGTAVAARHLSCSICIRARR
jgi:WD40 repeat protein